ncbi:DUF1778 domain-containing protein [Rhodoligotrophos defluvii]|uniref:type II toxin-antitoxin system TacA family antitoxin n=1 Tax=Rhodoligotrophos defluvii TaxID=2561934 RepID=UPI00195F392A|nr:hypothetical protein [Rhodoligotrophos defluvii]
MVDEQTDGNANGPSAEEFERPMRMDAYYYGFTSTGVQAIDRILSAVACAGKAYHHTGDWTDETAPYEPFFRGACPVDWIQNAAYDAATALREAAERRRSRREPDLTKCPNCGGEADNGFDRGLPPSPYYCSKCEAAERRKDDAAYDDLVEILDNPPPPNEALRRLMSEPSPWPDAGREAVIEAALDAYFDADGIDPITAVRAAISTYEAHRGGGAVKVKPLEWHRGDGIRASKDCWTAKSVAGEYVVIERQWWLEGDGVNRGTGSHLCESDDEAKAAAQADYAQRILSAIEVKP